ncbi:hypothetical protein ABZZ44_08695 [Streptomyces sp. NPDC006460]|uniref:hypothetical protein n=1 Tax=Streptomyces sp. NPDC006460 TaxID=3154304 RepID=UPI0033A52A88
MTGTGVPLLPRVLRTLPFDWGAWPAEESGELVALARAVLEAGLPDRRLDLAEPPVEVDESWLPDGDLPPDWVDIRAVLLSAQRSLPAVTVGQLAAVEAECARRGLDTTDFEEVWTRRITAWVVEHALVWCGLMVDDLDTLAPWFPPLAGLYVRRRMAVDAAVGALIATCELPGSRAVLAGLAADAGLPGETRERITDALG